MGIRQQPASTDTDTKGPLVNEPRHIVGLSGGGDSTAMALWLAEHEPRDYTYICNATGNELPALFEHLTNLERLLGKPIEWVRHTTDLYGLIDEIGMIPNHRARWCTRILKIEPTIEYFASCPPRSVLYVGLLAGEEARTGIYGEDITCRFPLRDMGWNKAAVRAYNKARGVSVPDRTDCALCYHQRIPEWHRLWREHPDVWARGEEIEARIGRTFRSPGRDTWPVALKDMRAEFERGRQPRKYEKRTDVDVCRVCTL